MCGFPEKTGQNYLVLQPSCLTASIVLVYDKKTWKKKPVLGHKRVSTEAVILKRQLVKSDCGLRKQPLLHLHLGRNDTLSWRQTRKNREPVRKTKLENQKIHGQRLQVPDVSLARCSSVFTCESFSQVSSRSAVKSWACEALKGCRLSMMLCRIFSCSASSSKLYHTLARALNSGCRDS